MGHPPKIVSNQIKLAELMDVGDRLEGYSDNLRGMARGVLT
jgi:hypothetical protein